ncbi:MULTISPECIES: DUF6163 family protein [Lichenihabitans]|uniref:DUF6163 family protein n=1 Tax=Lichenihabitans TaxID=2723776 RepID=UPI001036DC26|nr:MULTISPECIES: DUF6163 family protein [Lichenihabitans]UDL95391.1 DUF6163 family protein [Lichenihabitans sp. PAMC28606]
MKSVSNTPRYKPPLPAIKIGSAERSGAETRFGTLLVWFMRLLSLLWVLQGLLHWWSVLSSDADSTATLSTMTSIGVAAVMFFAVIDLVAAVGLWLAAAWGGVVWLVTVAAQWLTILILPGFFDFDLVVGVVDVVLVIVYFLLTYQAARENAAYV